MHVPCKNLGIQRKPGSVYCGGTMTNYEVLSRKGYVALAALYLHIHCRAINIFISHNLLPSDLVAQSVEQRWSNPKGLGQLLKNNYWKRD